MTAALNLSTVDAVRRDAAGSDAVMSLATLAPVLTGQADDGQAVTVPGVLFNLVRRTNKAGAPWAWLMLADTAGRAVPVVVFPGRYTHLADVLTERAPIVLSARVDRRGHRVGLVATDIRPIDQITIHRPGGSNRQERPAGPGSTTRQQASEETPSMTHHAPHRRPDPVPDPYTVVGAPWPVDGPYSPEHTATAARAAAELVRYLNHATRTGAALPDPVAVYDTLTALAVTVDGLPQTLRQMAARLSDLAEDDNIAVDSLGEQISPSTAARWASDTLTDAASQLAGTRRLLAAAHTLTGRLYLNTTPEDGAR